MPVTFGQMNTFPVKFIKLSVDKRKRGAMTTRTQHYKNGQDHIVHTDKQSFGTYQGYLFRLLGQLCSQGKGTTPGFKWNRWNPLLDDLGLVVLFLIRALCPRVTRQAEPKLTQPLVSECLKSTRGVKALLKWLLKGKHWQECEENCLGHKQSLPGVYLVL